MMVSESMGVPNPSIVLLVKDFLDKNFTKELYPDSDERGVPKDTVVFGMKDSNGEIVNTMTAQELFYFLQEQFKHVEKDKETRDKLLKQIIRDWVDDKITREGGLSVNEF